MEIPVGRISVPKVKLTEFKLLDNMYTKDEYINLYIRAPFSLLRSALKAKIQGNINKLTIGLGMTGHYTFLSEFLIEHDAMSYVILYQCPFKKIPFFINSKHNDELACVAWRLEMNR